ncbi:MAG TPA: hypothetical protein VH253_01385 [Phycisphaerae bacterium]|nr:hypothetical protein [Phycisphaerae bacterium]
MTRLNLTDASLLDISGELGSAAQDQLHARLDAKPDAQAEYHAVAEQYTLLRSLPQPQVSDAQKARMTDRIKAAIHAHLDFQARGKQALRRARLIHYALAGLSAAAAVAVIAAGLVLINSHNQKPANTNIARVNRVIDRLAPYDTAPGTYDAALDDVDSSVQQLQAEESSVSGTQTQEMTPLLEVLASLPANPTVDGGVDELEVPQGGM